MSGQLGSPGQVRKRRAGTAPDVTPSPPTPADLYTQEPGEEEPAWVQTEREQFRDFRDLNKDGRLDGSEVGHWVLPPAQDQPLVEANHLLHESDTDKVRRGGRAGDGRQPGAPLHGLGPELPGSPFGSETGRAPGKGRTEILRRGQTPKGGGDRDPEREGQRPAGHSLSPLTSDPRSRMGV